MWKCADAPAEGLSGIPTKIPEKMLAGKERGGVNFDKKISKKNTGAACIGKQE